MLRQPAHLLFDVLFPPYCAVCGGDVELREEVICDTCRLGLAPLGQLTCSCCGAPVTKLHAARCRRCPKGDIHFTRTRCAFSFQGAVRDAIHRFKFQGAIELARPLAHAMVMAIDAFHDARYEDERPHVLIPVPMHRLRRVFRGYNHSEELARELSIAVQIPCLTGHLRRSRYTRKQSLTPPEKRESNIHGAFQVPFARDIEDLHIGLIDDVFTSGSTVNECSRALKQAGAGSISVFTLARA